MMNIITASRLRQVDNSEFLYIGNMADVITNETQLATRLSGVDASDITQFQITGNDIKCKVSKVFSVLNFENSNVTFFVSKSSSLQTDFTGFTDALQLKSFAHYNNSDAVRDENFKNSGVKHLFFPNAKICGGYASLGNLIDTKIYMPNVDTFDRIVSGGNNIVAGSSNLTIYKDPNVNYPFVVDNFVDILDTTTPNIVTDLIASEIGGTYVRLNFTEITNADFYELWIYNSGLDTFLFKGEITNNSYIAGLKENTNYQIKIATCDQYWNGSGFFEDENKRAFSNTINVTSTIIDTVALFQNAVAYYKLNETSGDAIDVVNGYNGALFGGVTQGISGKIGTGYSFDGITTTRVTVDVSNIDFTSDFTIRIWSFIDDSVSDSALWSLNLPNDVAGWLMYGDTVFGSANRETRLFSQFTNSEIVFGGDIRNQFAQTTIVRSGLEVLLYINGVLIDNSTHSNTSDFANISELVLANWRIVSPRPLKGILDEVTILGEAWTAGKVLDDYNNGIGTTI